MNYSIKIRDARSPYLLMLLWSGILIANIYADLLDEKQLSWYRMLFYTLMALMIICFGLIEARKRKKEVLHVSDCEIRYDDGQNVYQSTWETIRIEKDDLVSVCLLFDGMTLRINEKKLPVDLIERIRNKMGTNQAEVATAKAAPLLYDL